jgi:uncharacterized protein (DUF362 family)
MLTSIVSHPGVEYPAPEENYSPSTRYPEYQYEHLASKPNRVYEMVREVFAQAGLDSERFGTRQWNPLGRFVAQGSSVFVLCNFVYHQRFNETIEGFWAKCTHGSVLRAVLDYLLIAVGAGGRIAFGNAPVQSCNWERVLAASGADAVLKFYADQGRSVEARDLRLFIAERDGLGRTLKTEMRDGVQNAIELDLKTESVLSAFGSDDECVPHFRNTDYDARRTESYHSADSHRYILHRAALEADVIFSLPKLKTHEKVGVTCGLKGFVGAIGHKDCLAHHRFGSPKLGGDEYPDSTALRLMVSRFNERAYSDDLSPSLQNTFRVLDRNLQRLMRRGGFISNGGWHGNDTAWRMSLDIARILHYADLSGRMQNSVQRKHLSFIDGIIGGEGDGPLAPTPVKSGTFIFSDNVAMGDWAACRLMGFQPNLIPLIREAFAPAKYSLCETEPDAQIIYNNGEQMAVSEIRPVLNRSFAAPHGWRDYLKNGA